jgi:glutaconate CoA-transferase, subunit A
MDEWAFGCKDHEEYCEKVGWVRLKKLAQIERKFCKSKL